jgi:hypothetical protein
MMFQFYGYGRFGPFSQALLFLEQLGLLDAILPFILIFAVFYGVLDQVKVFANNRINAIIALSVSLLTVIPHILGYYPPSADVVVIMNRSLPEIALIALALVLVIVLTGLLTKNKFEDINLFKENAHWIAIALVGLTIYGAIAPPTWVPGFLSIFTDPFFYTIMIILLVFGLVIWAVVGNDKKPPTNAAGQPPGTR